MACVGNVSAPDFADRFIKTAVEHFKGIDIIVNNAGYTWDNVIQKMTDEQWYAILDCHLTAPFRILRAAYPMIKASGKADKPKPAARCSARWSTSRPRPALNGNAGPDELLVGQGGRDRHDACALASEWGRFNVNVNCVAFGLIHTRMTSADAKAGATVNIEGRDIRVGVNPEALKSHAQRNPLGRGGTPEEAAGAVYLFCSPESNYITGQTIAVAGNLQ